MCKIIAWRRAECLCIQFPEHVRRCNENKEADPQGNHVPGWRCGELVRYDDYHETDLPCNHRAECHHKPIQPDRGEKLQTVQTKHGPRLCVVDERGGHVDGVIYQRITPIYASYPSRPSYRVETDLKVMESLGAAGKLDLRAEGLSDRLWSIVRRADRGEFLKTAHEQGQRMIEDHEPISRLQHEVYEESRRTTSPKGKEKRVQELTQRRVVKRALVQTQEFIRDGGHIPELTEDQKLRRAQGARREGDRYARGAEEPKTAQLSPEEEMVLDRECARQTQAIRKQKTTLKKQRKNTQDALGDDFMTAEDWNKLDYSMRNAASQEHSFDDDPEHGFAYYMRTLGQSDPGYDFW